MIDIYEYNCMYIKCIFYIKYFFKSNLEIRNIYKLVIGGEKYFLYQDLNLDLVF